MHNLLSFFKKNIDLLSSIYPHISFIAGTSKKMGNTEFFLFISDTNLYREDDLFNVYLWDIAKKFRNNFPNYDLTFIDKLEPIQIDDVIFEKQTNLSNMFNFYDKTLSMIIVNEDSTIYSNNSLPNNTISINNIIDDLFNINAVNKLHINKSSFEQSNGNHSQEFDSNYLQSYLEAA